MLLEVSVFDMDRGAELTMVNADIDIQECDMGGGVVPCEVDGIVTSCSRKVVREFRTMGVDPGGPVVIILSSGSEVCGFDPGRGRCIFSEHNNPEYDFLWKGSKAMGPVS